MTKTPLDPTTAAIEARNDELDQLRAENDRLSKLGDTMFIEGFDQAVREIRDHFKKVCQDEVVTEIEKTWLKGSAS